MPICTVKADGHSVAACTQPAAPDLVVENESQHINAMRRNLVEMLFHEVTTFARSARPAETANCRPWRIGWE